MGRRLSGLGRYRCLPVAGAVVVLALAACQPAGYRKQVDKTAYRIIEAKQRKALGQAEPFTIEKPSDTLRRRLIAAQMLPTAGPESIGADVLPRIPHWPEKDYPSRIENPDAPVVLATPEPLELSLVEALQIAAKNSREYQTQKEEVFRAALDLEFEADLFRNSYFGLLESLVTHDRTAGESATAVTNSASLQITRRLKSGAALTGRLGIALVNLLSPSGETALEIVADATVTIPLLRGSGRHIVTEPLTQAERNVIYALWDFERFRQTFVVDIVSRYLAVLQAGDQIEIETRNYESQVITARRAGALFEEDRISKIELDQSRQEELNARDRWIAARKRYIDAFDAFKQALGVPTDAALVLEDPQLREQLASYAARGSIPQVASEGEVLAADAAVTLPEPTTEGAGPYEIDERRAILVALDERLDLRIAKGEVYDAQRRVVVAADALRAGLNLVGTAEVGRTSSTSGLSFRDALPRPDRGFYSAGLALDLPFERTAEALNYRESYIFLDRSVRDVQDLEDQIKAQIRESLRELVRARESYTINRVAVDLAAQRVDQTRLELDLGRQGVEIRDLLEAQESLLGAETNLNASLVDYRIAELELQRDMGVLAVNEKGLFDEYDTIDN